jgi:2'-5' RNA ligase
VDDGGSSGSGHQSAVLIPVPDAEGVVGRWRASHDPAVGVPAHVTLVLPWLSPERIDDAAIEALRSIASAVPAWDFALTDVAWFGRRVLWLSPQPADPFRALTALVAERFDTPPWAGAFDEVVPHLTVAHAAGDDEALRGVEARLRRELPVRCRAEQLWVMVGDGHNWSLRAVCPLGTTAPDAAAGAAARPVP